MLNHLDQGLDKGHVMHFKDELQPIMFARIWFLLQLCETDMCLFSRRICFDFQVDLMCSCMNNVNGVLFCKFPFTHNPKCLEHHSPNFSFDVIE